MLERLLDLAKQALIVTIGITIVIFLLYHLFTDPVGSAHFVGMVFGKIWDALSALLTFGQELGK
jgi:hypothetical protein